jgi:hypothetical protein
MSPCWIALRPNGYAILGTLQRVLSALAFWARAGVDATRPLEGRLSCLKFHDKTYLSRTKKKNEKGYGAIAIFGLLLGYREKPFEVIDY